MSSAVLSDAAALRRPFIFDADVEPQVGCPTSRRLGEKRETKIASASVTPASQLEIRPAPDMVSSGIPAIDALIGGLPRGCLTEVCGHASAGRTTVLLAALAAATRRGEFCALIDASDSLDPQSVSAAGADLDRLLWVRCGEETPPKSSFSFDRSRLKKNGTKENASEHRLEQVLRATDLLLESGGFGLIVLDLADLPPQAARRIPLTTWFRFRRAVEHKLTILLAIEEHPIAGSCSSLLLQLGAPRISGEPVSFEPSHSSREAAAFISPGRMPWVGQKQWHESQRDGTAPVCADSAADDTTQLVHPTHTHLLTGVHINAELIRSRLERKPARSITFTSKTAWAG